MSSSTNPALHEAFLAGEFLVLPERNELRRRLGANEVSAEPIRLTSKQMGVLLALAAKPGQPVSKNELFEAVWPGVSVGEDNITSCIYELRQAFGDQAYIKTVRQRGYLFNAGVVRPAPAELVAAVAAPEKPAATDIPLPGADSERPPAAAPRPAERLDRQGRRLLVMLLSAILLLASAGLLARYQLGNFTVGLERCRNLTGDSEYDTMADMLGDRLYDRFQADKQINPTYYRIWRLGFVSRTSLGCSIESKSDGRIALQATIDPGLDGGEIQLSAAGSRDDVTGLTTQLYEKTRRALDAQACLMDTEPDLLKARHCFDAGARQLKNRSWAEALKLLGLAEKYYRQPNRPEDRKQAAAGLLLTYDQLANYYDIQGEIEPAREMVGRAHALLRDSTLGLAAHGPGSLRIERRQAQIENAIATERDRLEDLGELEPDVPDWRHSLGWFVFTHERDCTYAEKTFLEALVDHDIDPAIRATYYSYLGDIQLACGQPAAALASYEEHVKLAPDQGDPYDMRGNALMMMGRYLEAQQDFLQALRLDPALYSAIANKGHLERDQGYFKDAQQEYERFLAIAGDKPNPRRDILIAIGRLALLNGEPTAALKAAEEAIGLEGGNRIQAYWLQGLAWLDLDRVDAASDALLKLEQQFANGSRHLREYLHHLRAQIALAHGHGEGALRELQLALDNYPADRLFFLAAKAEGKERLKRDKEAFAAYRNLLDVNPSHPRSLCAAAALAVRLSLSEEAARLYADALKNLGERTDDPVCRQCLERGREFLARSGEER